MTPTKTETQIESHAEIQARPGGILAQINVGALLQFQTLQSRDDYAVADTVPGYPPMVLRGQRSRANATFRVTAYSYDGRNQAKISLFNTARPEGYWAVGQSVQGFSNPIVISDRPGEFLLTDTGNGIISIQNTLAPPNPYIRVVPPGIAAYLSYGYPDPGGMAGLFNISIVG